MKLGALVGKERLANGQSAVIRPLSREQAIELGRKRYFTDSPCPNGHLAERYTSSRQCCVCSRISVGERKKRRRQSARGP
jgi:hypothetical protein